LPDGFGLGLGLAAAELKNAPRVRWLEGSLLPPLDLTPLDLAPPAILALLSDVLVSKNFQMYKLKMSSGPQNSRE